MKRFSLCTATETRYCSFDIAAQTIYSKLPFFLQWYSSMQFSSTEKNKQDSNLLQNPLVIAILHIMSCGSKLFLLPFMETVAKVNSTNQYQQLIEQVNI